LDIGRNAALDADISPEDVGELGTCSITFWAMVHTWRIIARHNESGNVARLEKTRLACSFSLSEVEEFQKVYSQHVKQEPDTDSDSDTDEPVLVQRPRRGAASMPNLDCGVRRKLITAINASPELDTTLEAILGMNPVEEMLNFESLRKLLGHLHLRLSPVTSDSLGKEVLALTGSPEGSLDFANFLFMMRWMLDTDFAHLNDTVAKNAVSE